MTQTSDEDRICKILEYVRFEEKDVTKEDALFLLEFARKTMIGKKNK